MCRLFRLDRLSITNSFSRFPFPRFPVSRFPVSRFQLPRGCRQLVQNLLIIVKGKGESKRSIAVRKKPHRYGNSRAIRDHTVLPAIRQRWHSRLYPSRSWYSIKRPRGDARLSWPSWLVTARDGIPTVTHHSCNRARRALTSFIDELR